LTTCSVAAQYSSTNVTATVYTPVNFEPPSSLSHFEDMCSWGVPLPVCTPTPATPGYNNLYYVMSNAGATGPCFVKRYLREEEKQVLCDLGYRFNYNSTLLTYTSNAAGATHTYSFGCTASATIVGFDDGYNAGAYSFTTSGTSCLISTVTIIGNDIPNTGLNMSCLEVVYGNATLATSGASIVVNAPQASGLIILKYFPRNANNVFGNATYIYVYFDPNSCNVATDCNMIQNSGFESVLAGNPACGFYLNNLATSSYTPIQIGCWAPYQDASMLFSAGCFQTNNFYNLGNSTLGLPTPVSSYNGATGNDNAIGVYATTNYAASIKGKLLTPLINGFAYRLSFWALNLPTSQGISPFNPNNAPVVISACANASFAFNPIANFPNGLNPLTTFMVNPSNSWVLMTNTFVFSGPPSSAFIFGMASSNSTNAPLVNPGPGQIWSTLLCFIDDISLVPIPNPAFVIPQPTICSGVSLPNLNQYVSTLGNGTAGGFSGTGVTYNGQYNFNASGTLTAGLYPIAFTYTNAAGCIQSLWQIVAIQPTVSLLSSGNTTYCATGGTGIAISFSQTGSFSGISYSWQPGGFTGTMITVSPTVSTIYTVTAFNSSVCSASGTVAISVFTNCCGTTTFGSTYSGTLVGSPSSIPSWYTPLIVGDLTIFSQYAFKDEIFVFKDVKITIAPGAAVYFRGAHIHACSSDMWKGIVVEDGGQLVMMESIINGKHNLIEDAVTAIAVNSHSTSSAQSIINLRNTTFNKNFIDIKITDYQRSTNTFSNSLFNIRNCVFSCRNFTYTNTSWPFASTNDLRSASYPTTGISSPYLLNSAPLATLLAPYAGQTSSIAICLSTVGLTSGSNYYGIGLGSSTASEFNLFDNHCTFIDADLSNLTLINNVFQNTKFSGVSPGNGSAVYHHTASFPAAAYNFLSRLEMRPPTLATQNRFWNCHRGVHCKNTYLFYIDKTIFRSQQNATFFGTFVQGHTGILLNTNRFRYWINNCEFSNISNPINIPIAPDNTTLTASTNTVPYGIFAGGISIQQNTIQTGSWLNPYTHNAITITAPTQASWAYATASFSPALMGVSITGNTLNDVYRGINVNGMYNFSTRIADNYVRVYQDNSVDMGQQFGVSMSNCPINAQNINRQVISNNTLRSVGNSILSSPSSLIFCGNNMGAGLYSPSVTCNDVRNGFNGFEFQGPNQGAVWMGNQMQNLARGMLLSYNGVIGTQGGPNFVMANGFNGSWTPFVNYGLYTFTSSATQSSLYVGYGVSDVPPNLMGAPTNQSYASYPPITSYAGIGYNCAAPTNIVINPNLPNQGDYFDANSFYIAKTAMYRYLMMNDSIRDSNAHYDDFIHELSGTSIDYFLREEMALALGNYSIATYYNAMITATNNVENNYLRYYSLYNKYASNNFKQTNINDETNLVNLSASCPGTDGACVYQARALYNAVFNTLPLYSDCHVSSARIARVEDIVKTENNWDVSLFPNPAENKLMFHSNTENDVLSIIINDLSGRNLLDQEIKLSQFFGTLDLDLVNGVYLVNIYNKNNELLIKKLLIAK
jgi:hypothetical protein